MSITFARTTFHGYTALQLKSEALRVTVVPEVGARIVSLFDLRAGREWLVTPEQASPLRSFPYGTSYNENQSGGWDEMFPTIIACNYPGEGPEHGTALPDHGEAWTVPWTEEGATEEGIVLNVAGRALPYRLRRELSLVSPANLSLTYTLVNLGSAPLAYLWAAHPQFACDPGATIVLPENVTEVINVLPLEWGPEFGPLGTRNRWPSFVAGDRAVRQDHVAGPEKGGGRKFYVPPKDQIAWGELRQPSGDWLRLSWEPSFAPYCGVWIDEGYLNRVSDMAFEPATGYYDSLVAAWDNGRVARLSPQDFVRWELRVQTGAGAAGG